MEIIKNLALKVIYIAEIINPPSHTKSVLVALTFLLSWWITSLNEAGCVLVLIALVLGAIKQDLVSNEGGVTATNAKLNKLIIDPALSETLKDSEKPVDVLTRQRLQEDLNSLLKFNKSLLRDIRNQRNKMYKLELTIAFVGTFLWGFGDRLEKLFCHLT